MEKAAYIAAFLYLLLPVQLLRPILPLGTIALYSTLINIADIDVRAINREPPLQIIFCWFIASVAMGCVTHAIGEPYRYHQ